MATLLDLRIDEALGDGREVLREPGVGVDVVDP